MRARTLLTLFILLFAVIGQIGAVENSLVLQGAQYQPLQQVNTMTTGTYTGTVYEPLLLKKAEGSHLFFENVYQLDYAGGMKFGLRMYPQNELLPHRMDFCYVRWL